MQIFVIQELHKHKIFKFWFKTCTPPKSTLIKLPPTLLLIQFASKLVAIEYLKCKLRMMYLLPVWADGFSEVLKTPMTLNSLSHVSIIGVKENITLKSNNIVQSSEHVLVIP